MTKEASSDRRPGWPGIPPRWTSSAKSGVGTAISSVSRVWFTLSHGILDEIYYPRVDQACTRDFGFIVTDGSDFFAEEKRDCTSDITRLEDGVPAFRLVNTHKGGRFRIIKDVLTDQWADVVTQRVRLEVLDGSKLRLFALLAPHLVNGGAHNTASIGEYKGHRFLFAEGDGTTLSLGCSRAFLACSAGYVGVSDGWQILQRYGHLKDQYDRAPDGNVALTAEISEPETEFRLALGFGRTAPEAGFRVRACTANPVQPPVGRIRDGVARLAGAPALARPQSRRPQRLPRQHNGAALSRKPNVPRRPDRQPVHPLGRQQR